MNNTVIPTEAVKLLAAMETDYIAALAARDCANADLDTAGEAATTALIDEMHKRAIVLVAAITTEEVKPVRAGRLILAAACGLRASEIKKIAEANRTSKKEANGIVLPMGRFENLSRGKGWCRLGSGNNVHWADRQNDGYLADAEGDWTVGSNDGFNRKDSVSWKVEKIGPFWIAN